jgi:prevent-host-death family protein
VRSISHRELRNESGQVLKSVAAGESFTVTNNGEPVARLVPIDAAAPDLHCLSPARVQGGFSGLSRRSIDTSTRDALDDLRGNR